jgi:hypothetical protein
VSAARRIITSVLATGFTIGTFTLTGSAAQAAVGGNTLPAPPSITYDTSAVHSQAVGAKSAASAASAAGPLIASVLSPAGCTGSTDYPHKSGTQASVHGRMRCDYAVPYVVTSTAITRDRWYGLETLLTDTSKRTNSWTSYDATPHPSCLHEGTYDYRGFSSHLSNEGGVSYTSNTSNWQLPGVSHFTC